MDDFMDIFPLLIHAEINCALFLYLSAQKSRRYELASSCEWLQKTKIKLSLLLNKKLLSQILFFFL
ncbi:CLUMA_CG001637, isoform A [Clunio marinus]|uniref:CLUMA_CG001637, isoform A n=1 Tax=Clunio marinus TaxID=568069 RepID=A0A1J1HJX6_9DIPT|nr:CLUMA_CG001637, isoform A [Clunio marinus]